MTSEVTMDYEDINEYLDQPDTELQETVDKELREINLIEACYKFTFFINKQAQQTFIGNYMTSDNLFEFINWIQSSLQVL